MIMLTLAFEFPVPGREEDMSDAGILKKIIEWHDAWDRSPDKRFGRPDTKMVTEFFGLKHEETLKILNRFERLGWIVKERRISGGLAGNGFDGALYSGVAPTDAGRALFNKSAQKPGVSDGHSLCCARRHASIRYWRFCADRGLRVTCPAASRHGKCLSTADREG